MVGDIRSTRTAPVSTTTTTTTTTTTSIAETAAAAAAAAADTEAVEGLPDIDASAGAASVRHALEDAGLTPHARGDAYQYGENLRQRADMQEIVGLTVSELEQLPPGTVIVYGRSAEHTHGHVTVVSNEVDDNGERLESSDHQQRLERIAHSPAYGTDFGAGPTDGPRYRVFVPTPLVTVPEQ